MARARCLNCIGSLLEETFCSSEEAAMNQLASRHRVLGTQLDTRSDAGYRAVASCLEALAVAAQTLRAEKASRSYRTGFTRNYRSLFAGEARGYRVDILEACLDRQEVIYVNGEKYEFTREALTCADTMQQSWHALGALLERWWLCLSRSRSRTARRPTPAEVRAELEALDSAWAAFEARYLGELISIEARGRGLVLEALGHERRLRSLEDCAKPNEPMPKLLARLQAQREYSEEQCLLVACMGQLNAVANIRRKGRDDLQPEILVESLAALDKDDADAQRAALVLATDVVESYDAIRVYLQNVSGNLERVDPHLSNNTDLVNRLVDWEESWEVGAKYVQNPRLFRAICDVVAQLRLLQRSTPAFKEMCDNCDVELFLILPRVIWFSFLQSPERADLLRSLLPDRFGGHGAEGAVFDEEVKGFVSRFQSLCSLLKASDSGDGHVMDCLSKRIINGMNTGAGASISDFSFVVAANREEASKATDAFMRDMECWSMELQRHRPEEWNQCTSILLQCLEGTSKSQRA